MVGAIGAEHEVADRIHPEIALEQEDIGAAEAVQHVIARAATQHELLCVGSLDRMTTDTHGLLVAGLDLAADAWADAADDFNWSQGLDWYIVHQVSKVHTTMLCDRLGINSAKVPLTFPQYGNVGPAAIPITAMPSCAPSEKGLRRFRSWLSPERC